MDREKTPQERAAFDCFLKKLDSRHFPYTVRSVPDTTGSVNPLEEKT
jgi:hypothetical protein